MLTAHQKSTFERNGFLLLKNFLSAEETNDLRATSLSLFDKPALLQDSDQLRVNLFRRHEEMNGLRSDPRVDALLKSLLGDDYRYAETEASVARRFYTDWHRDTDGPELGGEAWPWEPDVRLVQLMWYLQPQTEEYGGGLQIVPGSHLKRGWKKSDYEGSKIKRGFMRKVAQWADGAADNGPIAGVPYTIPTEPGDLLVFYIRCLHRATTPKEVPIEDIPEEHEKILISYAVSPNNRQYANYVDYLSRCSNKQYEAAAPAESSAEATIKS